MFDPYRKWLGIPEGARPPTHYQLLGIAPDERDLDVINSAVVQRSQYVRNFQTGKYAEEATRLLNEISAAKICLLDPIKRAEYDAQLPRPKAHKQPSATRPASPPHLTPLVDPMLERLAAAPAAPWASPLVHQPVREKGVPLWQIAVGAGAVVVLLLVAGLLTLGNGDDVAPSVAQTDAPTSGQSVAPGTSAAESSSDAVAAGDPVERPPELPLPATQAEPAIAPEDATEDPADSAPGDSGAAAPPVEPVEKPSEVIENSVGMKLIRIPAGEFEMGSPESEFGRVAEEKLHRVRLTTDFFLGQTEVTQAQYQRVMGTNPSYFPPDAEGKDLVAGLDTGAFPVDRVTWTDAREFCRRLAALAEERSAGRDYRLPTEAEWEYACRGGTQTVFGFGDSLISTQANFDGNHPYGVARTSPFLKRTTTVGSYGPNRMGLFDMHGNLWEWCADYHAEYPSGETLDPRGPGFGSMRVLRGGSWHDPAVVCRSALRSRLLETAKGEDVGFRVVCTVPESP
jgi:formylglycine-generating enzyme required for sulfatase activity